MHGGASLEEIVVPVITLTLKKQTNVQITVLYPDNIIADRHNGVTLTLYISDVESPDSVRIVVDDKTYQGKTENGTHFVFELHDIKRAKTKPFSADVFDASDLIGTISLFIGVIFAIYGGFQLTNSVFEYIGTIEFKYLLITLSVIGFIELSIVSLLVYL